MKKLVAIAATVIAVAAVSPAFADLVAYHNLDSATGLTFGTPESGTNDASIVGGGLFGSALSLDGDGDFADVDGGYGTALGTGARTMSVWFNQVDGTVNLRSPMTIGSNGNGTKFDIDIDNNNGGLEVGIGGGRTVDTGATLNNGSWQHAVALVGDGLTVQDIVLYLDGVQRTNTTTQTRPVDTNTTRWLFGTAANVAASGNSNIQFFNGLVDDGAIWNEALTEEEVAGLFWVGSSGLNYTAEQFDSLKQVHDAGTGSVVIEGLVWEFSTGLSGNTLSSVVLGGSGTGVTASAVPEPAAATLLLAGGAIAFIRRRR